MVGLGSFACGSDVESPDGGGGGEGGGGEGGGGGVCTPGSTMPCICHQGSVSGEMTCLADGSGYGDCGGACQCPEGRSDGCCAGDGICCSCVGTCGNPFLQDPATDAFIACVCQASVCGADACMNECAGQGIGADCKPCADAAGQGACQKEAAACPPP